MIATLVTNGNVSMEVASGANVQTMQVVVALNVVSLDDYVTKDELEAKNYLAWNPQEGEE